MYSGSEMLNFSNNMYMYTVHTAHKYVSIISPLPCKKKLNNNNEKQKFK